MFKYNENNLYERCYAIDVLIDPDKKYTFNGEFAEVSGKEIPIIDFNFQPGVKFTRGM